MEEFTFRIFFVLALALSLLLEPARGCSDGYRYVLFQGCVACPDGRSSGGAFLEGCSDCDPDQYSNGDTNHLCVACPAGSTGRTTCTCAAGKYFDPNDCVDCPTGRTSASSTITAKVTSCTPCPANTYSNSDTGYACDNCPAGTTSPPASEYCTCPVAHRFNPGGNCVECTNGESAAESTTSAKVTSCTPCPGGQVSNGGNGHICTACPAGTFGLATCTTCPTYSTNTGTGNSFCTCPAGRHFNAGGNCVFCPDGKTSSASNTGSGATSCTNCSPGQFANDANLHICEACPIGTYAPAAVGTCPTCPAGSSNTGTGNTLCTCPVGHRFNGAITSCDACPDGSTASASTTASPITTCTQCSSGWQSNAGTGYICVMCLAGQYDRMDDQNNCPACPSGTTSTAESTYCTCPQGSYFNAGACIACADGKTAPSSTTSTSPVVSACTNCAAGSYSDTATFHVCTLCPANKYTAAAGTGACTPCPTGTYTDGIGQTDCICDAGSYFNPSSCVTCPDGRETTVKSLVSAKATSCSICGAGYYSSSATNHKCTACPYGTYSASTGQGSCTVCPPGTSNVGTANTACTCVAGRYFDAGACVNCANGETSLQSTTTSPVTSCTACNLGSKSNSGTNFICVICSAVNTYNDAVTHQADCYPCPLGTTSPGSGATFCSCPAGSYFNSDGHCVMCPDGKTASASKTSAKVSSCTACSYGSKSNTATGHICTVCTDLNTYNDATTGQAACYPCPGSSTAAAGRAKCHCNAGYYFNAAGYCVPCEDGTSAAASTTLAKVTACTACNPGFKSNAASSHLCEACNVANTYSDSSTGQKDCYSCPGYSHNAVGGTFCTCDEGYFFNTDNDCVPCPDGSTSSVALASSTAAKTTSCSACSIGYQSNSDTAHRCVPCIAPNTYNDGIKLQAACYHCPGSSWNSAGGTFCTCNAGYFFDSLGNCVACPDGESAVASTTNSKQLTCSACTQGWQSNSGTLHICTICGINTYNDAGKGKAACFACPQGSTNTGPGSTYCECKAGYYWDTSGTEVKCLACPDGKSSAASTTASVGIGCVACLAGTSSSASTAHLCLPCATTTYNDAAEGQSTCVPCPIYTTNSGMGSTSCALPACPKGHYILPDAQCVPCLAGTYQDVTQQTSCKPCPADSTSIAGAEICTCDSHYYYNPTYVSAYCQRNLYLSYQYSLRRLLR